MLNFLKWLFCKECPQGWNHDWEDLDLVTFRELDPYTDLLRTRKVYNRVCIKCGEYRPDGNNARAVAKADREVDREIRESRQKKTRELARKKGWTG